ncbi:transglycosylase domain-containing protein [Roseinatronobacter bogoriensis]|uniref:peptidoglycan glycosyltransferase n=1 Tax=Roseinatronobacter bogoriensis subsp. barguzinensis TaxID=441209 RepID=A0A2K8K677_9RHOB|nr:MULTISPECIES: transglycosylase domain-containing protein [Rhodobaca]ATX64962.1 penicillin-binding protein [Rhodobaca barguzinensis]TDW37950.1 1A family penicillin-binding protein [Rhodobaca barguzinensis]TDY69880.1 1A family penicillin-binding protein [Rhodobaca bogoriensis DSM 18756]
MGNSGGNGRKLTADRREVRPSRTAQARPRKAAVRKTAPAKRKSGNIFVRFIAATVGLIWKLIWGVTWRLGATVAMLLFLASAYYYMVMPPLGDLLDARARGSVTMTDSSGNVFAWRGETFGGIITADTVSPYLKNAIIATEDRRFYSHLGVSPRGIAGAIRSNMQSGRSAFSGAGGSTITQQVAKLLCLGVPFDPDEWSSEAAYEADCRRGTIWRKIKELPFAFALEASFSKDEILTIYMNRAFLGAGARGFEAASQRYFGRSANEVGPAEGAMLAGLLVAPSTFAPTRNLARAQARANVVIGLMHEQGYLTEYELAEARSYPATLSSSAEAQRGIAFADWLMQSGPAFLTRDTTEDVMMRTTFDPRIQTAIEEAVTHVFDTRVRDGSEAEVAVVVMSPDGAVRGMVGGRSASVGGFNRATQAMRQTGSAFKPFLYAAALENGFEPFDIVEDAPLTITTPGSGAWSPRNYDNEFRGFVTMTEALARSLNTPAVRISEAMGRERVREVANQFGLHSDLAEGPALALGASEANLLEMTAAYAGILSGGNVVRPYGIEQLRLLQESAPLFEARAGVGESVISERSAQVLTWMMTQVVTDGTGGRARLNDREVAGKTGTTQASRDAWFIGYTADYVAGVWMGYDDNSPLQGVTGGGLPAEIWREAMERVHNGVPARPLPMIVPERPVLEAPQTAPAPDAQPFSGQNIGNTLEDTIRGVLGSIFGGN